LLLTVALLGCMVAWAYADDSADEEKPIEDPTKHSCGPLQKLKIKRQWRQAFGEGSKRLEFSLHFWISFFRDMPKAREMFKNFRGDNIYSPQFQAESLRRLAGFSMIVDTTDDPEALKIMLEAFKAEDKAGGFTEEYNQAGFAALLETLAQHLGSNFDWDAWVDCLTSLATAVS